MNNYSGNETVNAGTGKELTIKELTELVAKVIGYTGEIRWDPSKPNGTPRKLLDVSKSTLKKYGAVSAQTAKEMAKGGVFATDADICVAITGWQVPTGRRRRSP